MEGDKANEPGHKELLCLADDELANNNLLKALELYTQLLSKGQKNVNVLSCRAAILIELKEYEKAKKDVEELIQLDPQNPKGYYLLALASEGLSDTRKSLFSYLRAYQNDPSRPNEILENVLKLVSTVCSEASSENIDKSTSESRDGENTLEISLEKLRIASEKLLAKKEFSLSRELCETILAVADTTVCQNIGSFEDGGLFPSDEVMHSQLSAMLTLSSAQLECESVEKSIETAEKCRLSSAEAKHRGFEMRSYILLANSYHRCGNYVQAISFNEKVLSTGRDLDSSEAEAFGWNKQLECQALWNLSACYNSLGLKKKALKFASEYLRNIHYVSQENLSKAYAFVGKLQCSLNLYDEATHSHEIELAICRKFNDRAGMGSAYGCLGLAYVAKGNKHIGMTYLEQALTMARNLEDKELETIVLQHIGETCAKFIEHDKAIGLFQQQLNLSKENHHWNMQCMALIGMGKAFKAQGAYNHAKHYLEQGMMRAKDLDSLGVAMDAAFHLAEVFKILGYFENARKTYKEVIIYLEKNVNEFHHFEIVLQNEIADKLNNCYRGLIQVLVKLDRWKEAFEITEHCHSKFLCNLVTRHAAVSGCVSERNLALSIQEIMDTISVLPKQTTILYYTLSPTGYYLWMLKPCEQLFKFVKQNAPPSSPLTKLVRNCVNSLGFDSKGNRCCYESDFRKPYLRKSNFCAGAGTNTFSLDDPDTSQSLLLRGTFPEFEPGLQSIRLFRELFQLLLNPVEHLLDLIPVENQIVFIPDGILNIVPFHLLVDKTGRYLFERFRISVLPCIGALSLKSISLGLSDGSYPSRTLSESEYPAENGAVIIGNTCIKKANLSNSVGDTLSGQSVEMKEELELVSNILGVPYISGTDATKNKFLEEISRASLVHVAVPGSSDGSLILSPNIHRKENIAEAESYTVTLEDLAQVTLQAELVILSSSDQCVHGLSENANYSLNLASGFLCSGARTVLVCLWSVPHKVLQTVWYRLYKLMQEGHTVSRCLQSLYKDMSASEKFSQPLYWGGLILLGYDSRVNIKEAKNKVIQSTIDSATKESRRMVCMRPKEISFKDFSLALKAENLQFFFAEILANKIAFTIFDSLQNLLSVAVAELKIFIDVKTQLNERQLPTIKVSKVLLASKPCVKLLAFLGFKIEPGMTEIEDPYVILPPWSFDSVLPTVLECVTAIQCFTKISFEASYALSRILPLVRLDMLEIMESVLKMAQDITQKKLHIHDNGIRRLWASTHQQSFLKSIGFYNIGTLLLWNKGSTYEKLRDSANSLAVALGTLYRRESQTMEKLKNSQVQKIFPWFTEKRDPEETKRKFKLASEMNILHSKFDGLSVHGQDWHIATLRSWASPHSRQIQIGPKVEDPEKGERIYHGVLKVKVKGGGTPSCNRFPILEIPKITAYDTYKKRERLELVFIDRQKELRKRKPFEVRQLYNA